MKNTFKRILILSGCALSLIGCANIVETTNKDYTSIANKIKGKDSTGDNTFAQINNGYITVYFESDDAYSCSIAINPDSNQHSGTIKYVSKDEQVSDAQYNFTAVTKDHKYIGISITETVDPIFISKANFQSKFAMTNAYDHYKSIGNLY